MADSIGIDIVDCERIKKLLEKYPDRFVKKILAPAELTLFESRVDRIQFLAGRLAVKEAIIKALGRYLTDRPALNSLEISYDKNGQPELLLPENIKSQLRHVHALVSISHEKSSAVGMAVFTEEK